MIISRRPYTHIHPSSHDTLILANDHHIKIYGQTSKVIAKLKSGPLIKIKQGLIFVYWDGRLYKYSECF